MKRQTFIEYSRIILISLAIFLITAIFSLVQFLYPKTETVSITETDAIPFTVIIDPGHGGEDGGAVGFAGSLEKQINLSVSLEIERLFNFSGIGCILTRSSDVLLYKDGQENRKKYYDLKNRVDFVNEFENPIVISVHQNKFPLEKYSGLQVYFSDNNNSSQKLATIIQNRNKEFLQKDNNRQIKKGGRNIYILDKLECPAVLVECGFLSNFDEEKLLMDKSYQKKLAFLIFSSVAEFVWQNNLSEG